MSSIRSNHVVCMMSWTMICNRISLGDRRLLYIRVVYFGDFVLLSQNHFVKVFSELFMKDIRG